VQQALPLSVLLGHAADAVQAVRGGRSLGDVLSGVPADARPGTQALAFHALRWLGGAQVVRGLLAPRTPPPAIDALLLTALALLWPTGEAPPYPAFTLVDQAVTSARRRVPAHARFVNAVLRRFVREHDALVGAAREDPLAAWQHPPWWSRRVRDDWPACWEELLAADNAHPPLTLRVNARRTSTAAYVERLAAAGIGAQVVGPRAVTVDEPLPVARLPGFLDGDVSVQDLAAQLAAPLLLAGEPKRVLDACAAPGGKTAHLLESADVDLLALDSDRLRLARVGENLARLGLSATLRAADARDLAAWWDGRPFDRILLDAPCSASGIVRRHPDVRWLRRPGDIDALARLQARLLDALWPLVARGGRLLYATCSVFKAEGEQQIDAFLQRSPDARVAAEPVAPGHLLPLADNRSQGGMAAATAASMDGFFYALLEKR